MVLFLGLPSSMRHAGLSLPNFTLKHPKSTPVRQKGKHEDPKTGLSNTQVIKLGLGILTKKRFGTSRGQRPNRFFFFGSQTKTILGVTSPPRRPRSPSRQKRRGAWPFKMRRESMGCSWVLHGFFRAMYVKWFANFNDSQKRSFFRMLIDLIVYEKHHFRKRRLKKQQNIWRHEAGEDGKFQCPRRPSGGCLEQAFREGIGENGDRFLPVLLIRWSFKPWALLKKQILGNILYSF